MATSENTMANVPTWSRPGLGGRGRSFYPKPLPRDKLKPLVATSAAFSSGNGRKFDSIASARSADRQTIVQMVDEARKRILQQEKDISFLTTQHKDVLKSLHEEIEQLKAENKDLQFKLIMSRGSEDQKEKRKRDSESARGDDDDLTTLLEKELHDLRAALKEELEKNSRLTKQVDQDEQEEEEESELPYLPPPSLPLNYTVQPALANTTPLALPGPSRLSQPYSSSYPSPHAPPAHSYPPQQRSTFVPSYAMDASTAGYGTSLKILRAGELPRPPTLGECELIIQHLHQATAKQKHELESVKSDLRDILFSSKWTPDAFLQAKKYIGRESDEFLSDSKEKEKNKTSSSVQLKGSVSLPPLRPNLENRAVERQKRQQAVHRERFRREVLH